jgi:hypothetical protein
VLPFLGVVLCALLILGGTATTYAAIEHGTFPAADVTFVDVTEASGTDAVPPALYGAPTTSGNSLVFSPDPEVFKASSSNGGAPDLTDGTLILMIVANAGSSIPGVAFSESGSVELTGPGGIGTFASAAAAVFIDILEVDGVGIDPVKGDFVMSVSPSGGTYNLAEDGPSPLEQTWTGSLLVDINQMLADAGITGVATKVGVSMDNTLAALSESETSSLVNKADLSITVVPEPGCLALAFLASAGFLLSLRKHPAAVV